MDLKVNKTSVKKSSDKNLRLYYTKKMLMVMM